MQNSLLSNFVFINVKFDKYHHTDCRTGSPFYYLAYMLKGHAKIVSDNKTILINEGDVFFIPKNLAYQSYWYGEGEIDFLSCGFSSLHTCENLNFSLQIVPCGNEIKERIKSLFSQKQAVSCEGLSCFYGIMASLLPYFKRNEVRIDERIADKIRACINENPHISMAKVAKELSISESYMYSSFKKATEKTPNDYKQLVLCEKGIELLLTTNKTVEEISELTAFSSCSYFRKVLKKHTGKTPKEIRQKNGF